jgi:L-aspartate oxidase
VPTRRNFEATNMLTVALAVAAAASERTESRGCHRRTDVTTTVDRWIAHLDVSLGDGELTIGGIPA